MASVQVNLLEEKPRSASVLSSAGNIVYFGRTGKLL